jgi:hypothetical protein
MAELQQVNPQKAQANQDIRQQAENRLKELDAEKAKLEQARNNPDLLESIFGGIEGALSLASGAVAPIAGGIVGLAASPQGFIEGQEGVGAATAKRVQDALTFEPQLGAGSQAVSNVAETLEPVAKGLEAARESSGEGALALTDSPFLASIAKALPDATLALLPVRSLVSPKSAIAGRFSPKQSLGKQKIAELISAKSDDISTANVKLSAHNLRSKITDGLPRVVKDKVAIKAMNQGLSPETTAMLKSSGKLDKARFGEMLNVAGKAIRSRSGKAVDRIGNVVGRTLLNRVSEASRINRRAGRNVNKIAETNLKNKPVDMSQAVQKFSGELKKLDVKVSDDLSALDFAGSALEGGVSGASTAQGILKITLRRLNEAVETGDALQFHKLKKFIDKQVSFGKTSTGGAGGAEVALKSLRKEINTVLGDNFAPYKKVNDTFSSSKSALDNFQKAAGTNLDLASDFSDTALGTKLRTLTNNSQGRANLMKSMAELEDVLVKNGVKFKDRVLEQSLFADDLEQLLKLDAATGLKKQVAGAAVDAVTGQPLQATIKAGRTALDTLARRSPENAIEAIRKLLRGQ